MSNPWLFDADRCELTPSVKDGYSKREQSIIRVESVRFIQQLGNEALKLHYSTVATAQVFFHRFYMFHSYKQFPVYPMAATCLFLAGKVEETPKKSQDIVESSQSILTPANFAQFGIKPKDEILTLEKILLQTIGFDFEVEHPYEYLIKYVKQLVVTPDGSPGDIERRTVLQKAWAFLNDSYCSVICLRHEPEIIAIAMIFLACKTDGIEVYDWNNKKSGEVHWWDAYVENLDITHDIEGVCHQLLDVIELVKPSDPQTT